jgi:hypothetical protein
MRSGDVGHCCGMIVSCETAGAGADAATVAAAVVVASVVDAERAAWVSSPRPLPAGTMVAKDGLAETGAIECVEAAPS